MSITIVSVDAIHRGWSRFSLARIRLATGEVLRREIEDHGRAVAVLPYDPKRKMGLLVRQFRAPVFLAAGEESLVEAIAGIVEETRPEDTARREAFEEAGLRLTALEPVAEAWTMPGLSTERLSLFLAPYSRADRVSEGGGVIAEQEHILVEEIALCALAAMVDSAALRDMKTLVLVQTLRLRRPDLFVV